MGGKAGEWWRGWRERRRQARIERSEKRAQEVESKRLDRAAGGEHMDRVGPGGAGPGPV
jgi:hypothetical protein